MNIINHFFKYLIGVNIVQIATISPNFKIRTSNAERNYFWNKAKRCFWTPGNRVNSRFMVESSQRSVDNILDNVVFILIMKIK